VRILNRAPEWPFPPNPPFPSANPIGVDEGIPNRVVINGHEALGLVSAFPESSIEYCLIETDHGLLETHHGVIDTDHRLLDTDRGVIDTDHADSTLIAA
jgi:hypothetical protein